MDRREELRRKLERIEREESAKQEPPREQGEASAPSTGAASASPPPAPSLTPEQVREIAQGEIEKVLRTERAARQEESAGERAQTEARLNGLSRELTDTIDELSQGLTDMNERVSSLRQDTHDSLIPMAEAIAELRSRQNSHVLPPAWEPRNVAPRPTWRPTTLSLPPMYPPRSLSNEPEMPDRTLERTSYQPPRQRSESNPPTVERTYETEQPDPLFFRVILALIIITILILAIWGVVTFLCWAWFNPWMAVALIAAALIFLGWVAAVFLTWAMGARMLSIGIVLLGVAVIAMLLLGYTTYQSWAEPKPDIHMLGR